jgi:hypothetical protein
VALCALSLSVAISMPQAAAAESCGHYVKRLGPGFVPGDAAAKQVADQSQAMAAHTAPSQTPCPCQGPECRRAPQDQVPLSPKEPARVLTPQELVGLGNVECDFSLTRGRFDSEISCRPSRAYPLGMNRPPCA